MPLDEKENFDRSLLIGQLEENLDRGPVLDLNILFQAEFKSEKEQILDHDLYRSFQREMKEGDWESALKRWIDYLFHLSGCFKIFLEPSLNRLNSFLFDRENFLALMFLHEIRLNLIRQLNFSPLLFGNLTRLDSPDVFLKLNLVQKNYFAPRKMWFLDLDLVQNSKEKRLGEQFFDLGEWVRDPTRNSKTKHSLNTILKGETARKIEDLPAVFLNRLKERSLQFNRSIILPEGKDLRVIQAAKKAALLGLKISLLGDRQEIESIARKAGISLPSSLNFVFPKSYDEYTDFLYELRKHKGMSRDTAQIEAGKEINLAALMLRLNRFDGMVGGAVYTSTEVLRSALRIVGLQKEGLASSFFLMMMPDGVRLFADCAVNPDPDEKQLAEIAWQTGMNAKLFLNGRVKVALVSYSTLDSADGNKQTDKIKAALSLIENRNSTRSGLLFEGPLQYDAAVNKKIAQKKAPESQVAGEANVLVFPNLETGNSVYKAVQQSAKILSIGPILQGLKLPINDLSRGATVDDIFYTILVTSIQNNH